MSSNKEILFFDGLNLTGMRLIEILNAILLHKKKSRPGSQWFPSVQHIVGGTSSAEGQPS